MSHVFLTIGLEEDFEPFWEEVEPFAFTGERIVSFVRRGMDILSDFMGD